MHNRQNNMLRFGLIAILFSAPLAFGFQSKAPPPIVVAARLIHSTQPAYPIGAQFAGIQGTVVFQALIDEQGVPGQITVLSPLGYGLDEAAEDAIRQWRYQPTTVDGKPVKTLTEIDVNFTLVRNSVDRKTEKQRTAYNLAVSALQKGGMKGADAKGALASVHDLASQEYSPALYFYGKMLQEGRNVPKDAAQGFLLVQQSAEKQFGPAMYDVAMARLRGDQLDKDPAKAMQLMIGAGKSGSKAAQWYLGQAYEKGDGVAADAEQARKYYRLCAANGEALCQFHLGKSLLERADHPERDYIQAIAWLELASAQKAAEADLILEKENQRLTPPQLDSVNRLKAQLVHKP